MSDWNQRCEALFEAGRRAGDEPSAEDRKRVARRIAAQLAGGITIAAASGALRTGSVGAAGASGPVSTGWLGLSAAKMLAALALGVGAAGAVAVAVADPHTASTTRAAAPTASQARSLTSSETVEPAVPMRIVPPKAAAPDRIADRVSPYGPAPSASAPSASAPSAHSPAEVASSHFPARTHSATIPIVAGSIPSGAVDASSAAPPSSLSPEAATRAHDTGGELRLVREIDDALRRGDYRAATQALDEHDAAFGPGHFGEECAAARVLALCGAGRAEMGRQSACEFASRYPRSPMNERISISCSVRCE